MKLQQQYDVVIIGSGAGGGTVAEALSHYVSQGLSVLILEAGPYWKKEQFNQREKDMSRLYFNRGAILSKRFNIAVAAGRAVGGSTAVYTGVSFRPPKDVWQKWRNQYGLEFLQENWINERLDYLEKMIHVQELPESWDNDNNRLFRQGCEKLGIPTKRLRINVKNCQQQGLCNLGCTSGAKQSTLEVQIPQALSRGVELLANAYVSHITPEEVFFTIQPAWPFTKANPISEGNYRIKAKTIVIAAGALHTPTILLRSRKHLTISPKDIGRYLTLHPALNVNAIYPKPIQNYRGFPKTYYVDAFSESEGYFLETSFYFPGVTAKNIPGFGSEHQSLMAKYQQMLSILILAHDPAEFHNRITISRQGNIVLDYRIHPKVKTSLVKALQRSAEIFFAAGCEQMSFPGSAKKILTRAERTQLSQLITEKNLNFVKTPLSSAHPQGGARMGQDPKNSVVNPNGQLHGEPSIFVADASLFPTSVKVNPYETVMLLADHVAEQIKQQVL